MDGKELLNTTASPPYLAYVREEARRARAYHALRPYPQFSRALKDWKVEERGPLPRCRPFVRNVTVKQARWLFGKPVSLTVADEEGEKPLTKVLNKVWNDNAMLPRMQAAAETGGQSGNLAVKFRHDAKDAKKVFVDILDGAEHARFYYDPQDSTKLLMVRIQYPFYDYQIQKWRWYREEWTDELYVTYDPLDSVGSLGKDSLNPDSEAGQIDKQEFKGQKSVKNPYGLIPVVHIKHVNCDASFGLGTLWSLWDAVDECNFTYDLGNKDNQKSVWPKTWLIDGEMKEDDAPRSNVGDVEQVESTTGDKQAKLQFYENQGALRLHIAAHADALKQEIVTAAGSVEFKPEDVTNKGSMTTAVLAQLYAPLIESTDERRQSYGEYGLAMLFEKMAKGMGQVAGSGFPKAPEELDVQVEWPAYFDAPEDEKLARVTRYALMEEKSFTTHEQAVRELATDEQDTDVEELVKLAKAQKEERDKAEQDLQDKQIAAAGRGTKEGPRGQ